MYVDCIALANTVEPTDAVLEDFGIGRKIEQHQMMGELKIATLASDLGTYQKSRSILLREICRISIALDERQSLMEQRSLHSGMLAQPVLYSLRHFARVTDQENLLTMQAAQ
jgi:hypothetical protein